MHPSRPILHVLRPYSDAPPPWFVRGDARDARWTPDGAILACAAMTEREGGRTLVLGPRAAAERCRTLGLRVDAAICPPLGIDGPCRRAIARAAASMDAGEVVSWDGGDRTPLARSLPASDLARRLAPRALARETVGVAPAERTLLLLADPPPAADAVALVRLVGMLHVAGVPLTVVVGRGARGLDRARRHVRDGGYVRRLIVVEGPTLAVLAAADLAVVLTPGCVPMSEPTRAAVRLAVALGVPTVAGADSDAGIGGAIVASPTRPALIAAACDASLRALG